MGIERVLNELATTNPEKLKEIQNVMNEFINRDVELNLKINKSR